MSTHSPLHLAVALEGAGWHPAAWREDTARPDELFSAGYWVDLARRAEEGRVDFVTWEDQPGLQSSRWDVPDGRRDQVRGRLDATLVAARVAPATSWVGLVPTAVTTHSEPFHLSKAVATLDFVSGGRAGWRAQISARRSDAAHFGRRQLPELRPRSAEDAPVAPVLADLFTEAGDYVEVVRRLWDSWEDDAEVRHVASGRFIDRTKLHYIDFEGRFFSVRGPSITPRPPQGQPPVVVLAHVELAYRLAVEQADVVLVTPHSKEQAAGIVGQIRRLEASAGRHRPLKVLADMVVFLAQRAPEARARRHRLDEVDGRPYRSDAAIVTATPAELADQMEEWAAAGIEGFRLRPACLPADLETIVEGLIPELQRRRLARTTYRASTLRGHLGLGRPANRYVAA